MSNALQLDKIKSLGHRTLIIVPENVEEPQMQRFVCIELHWVVAKQISEAGASDGPLLSFWRLLSTRLGPASLRDTYRP